MRIRTKLLLFLLPTMILGTLLITSILSYHWHQEVINRFKIKLKSAIVSCSISLSEKDLTNNKVLEKKFDKIKKEFNITKIEILPIQDSQSLLAHLKHKNIKNCKKLNLDLFFKNSQNPSSSNILFTPIHLDKNTNTKNLSAYAPIKNNNGNTLAYITADITTNYINKHISEGLFLIILISVIIILLMLISLFIIANKISMPVQKLNNSALFLAAGNYGDKIELKGPKEIIELSNTLNIMSECLYENINRLKENSIIRERMYGEYECSMLLQNHMLKKIIDENQSDTIAIKAINIYSSNLQGFLFDFHNETPDALDLRFIEARNKGFNGMYELLTNYKYFKENQKRLNKNFPTLNFHLNKKQHKVHLYNNKFNIPFIWSLKENSFLDIQNTEIELQPGDLFFIFNQGLYNLFQDRKNIKDIILKVLKYFSTDGLETVNNMLQKELVFVTKKKTILDDIHLICFQLLY